MNSRGILLLVLSLKMAQAVPLVDRVQSQKEQLQKREGILSSGLYGGDILGNPVINNAGFGTPWITEGKIGRIPFALNSSLDRPWIRERLRRAMDEIENKTCIRFVERNSSDPECGGACNTYLKIQNDQSGCNSYVGMRNICPQPVSMLPMCFTHSTIIHELGHAIGLLHTHQRSDRDEYINVHFENVDERYRRAFHKENYGRKLVPYDTSSVMHYGSYTATNNRKPTITLKNGGIIKEPRGLSADDVKAIQIMYGCES